MSNLIGVLTQIRKGITRSAYPNETAVRTQIVQPILQQLGWAVFDPDRVCNEFPLKLETKTRRIDLALCVSNRNPRCIIELKSTDYDLKQIGRSDGDKQLFQYAFHAGAPLALLTNGVSWRFYSTYGAGTYAERLVRALDMETQPLEEIAAALDRYLSYENTESGKPAHYAVEDLQVRIGRYKARQEIPRAWSRLVGDDPDERMVALLTEATSSLVESAPAKQDVVEFLRCLKPDDGPSQRKSKQSRKSASKTLIAAASKPGPLVENPAPFVEPHPPTQPANGRRRALLPPGRRARRKEREGCVRCDIQRPCEAGSEFPESYRA